ncbi:uncharacterized protein SETTUDRAFT_36307 [Exserohilum turcica Et28A]|uniref:Uncharacterized protein n=1 Tax=Exserohilum turcicum (strain 28A) TaxID=671987 RepID=R0KD11_EXST2|nr:uncharacterized protein SETTUDRAFT_36307 [Exserohilum turcica Et28A]EOA90798.1 hypothetical protein SETTUDRAFT_36307 [Exserohilum turcica Et28A]
MTAGPGAHPSSAKKNTMTICPANGTSGNTIRVEAHSDPMAMSTDNALVPLPHTKPSNVAIPSTMPPLWDANSKVKITIVPKKAPVPEHALAKTATPTTHAFTLPAMSSDHSCQPPTPHYT